MNFFTVFLDWKLIKSEDGYTVYRKFLGFGPSSQFACVMCHGIINAEAKAVLSLFEDNTRITEYNSLCKDIRYVLIPLSFSLPFSLPFKPIFLPPFFSTFFSTFSILSPNFLNPSLLFFHFFCVEF